MRPLILILALISLMPPAGAEQERACEVTAFEPYEIIRGSRTDFGIVVPQKLKCADVTFRNLDDRGRYATDFELRATYADGTSDTVSVRAGDDRFRRLMPGEEFTASECFGAGKSHIALIECGLYIPRQRN